MNSKSKKIHGSFAIKCAAIGLKPEAVKSLYRAKKASEIKPIWDYRKLGLTLQGAITALEDTQHGFKCYDSREISRAKEIAESPHNYWHPTGCSNIVAEYKIRRQNRDRIREKNISQINSARLCTSRDDLNEELKGWPRQGLAKVKLAGEKTLLIKRDEYVTWSEKKSWKYPESRSVSYTAAIISEEGDVVARTCLSSRTGDWIGKIGIGLGLRTNPRTKVTQSEAMIPVATSYRFNFKLTTLRLFGEGFDIFVAEGFKTHYHANTAREAIKGLIQKGRRSFGTTSGLLDDRAVLSRLDAERLRFCDAGVQAFLEEIGLADRDEVKAGEIRRLIKGKDVSIWADELEEIGIICRP